MRPLALLILLASVSCADQPPVALSPQDGPALPELGEPAAALTDREKKLEPAQAVREAAAEMAHHEDRLSHVIALLRYHWPSARDSAELNALLAQAHSRVVENLDPKKKEERERHRRHREAGKFHAEAALKADPNRGDAHYWLGAVLLHTADAEQSYSRLKEALKEMLAAEKFDPKCDSGGPDRMLGRIYQETPGGLLFLGSKPKAIEYYKKSLEIAPDFRLTHLWLAETHHAEGQKDAAKQEGQKAAEGKPRSGHEKEDGDVIHQAQELLKKIEAK